MYLYAYWPSNGGAQLFQAFKKESGLIDYALDQITTCVYNDKAYHARYKQTIPQELLNIESAIPKYREVHTVNATKDLIAMYEDYVEHCLGRKNVCHIIKDVKVIE